MNPPLREERDTLALRQALLDGLIDVVATDHAPHGSEDKCVEFENAKPGMLGLTKEQVWEGIKIAGVIQAVAQTVQVEAAR